MTFRPLWSRRSALAALAALGTPAGAQDAGARLESAFDQSTRLSVPVFLNGEGPFAFVVDTGANSSVVAAEVAERCGLPADGSAPVHGILSATPAPLVRVGRLRVGDVMSRNLRLPVLPKETLGAQGLLGLDVLRGRRVTLSFVDKTFEIAPSGEGPRYTRGPDSRVPTSSDPIVVPARFRSGQLVIVDASVSRQTVTAFLDSGSQVTVANGALRQLVLTAQPRLGEALMRSSLISATGQQAVADFGPLPGLRIGRMPLSPELVAFADLHIFKLWGLNETPALLIGVDLLRMFDKVAFDFGQRQIVFWPPIHGPRRR